jgi:hypothetical protein
MPRLSDGPQLRFLLRACGLVIVMLLVWWIFLLDPVLGWVRGSGDFLLGVLPGATEGSHVEIGPDGNWMLRLPVPAAAAQRGDLQQMAGGGRPKKVRSFKMQTSRSKVALFTVTLPLFLALLFSVRMPAKQLIRSLATGVAILAVLMPLALALFGMATIRAYFHIASTPAVEFLWGSAGYMNTEVLPYLVPLFLALWLNPQLRAQVFSWAPALVPPLAPPKEAALARRERKRLRRRDART